MKARAVLSRALCALLPACGPDASSPPQALVGAGGVTTMGAGSGGAAHFGAGGVLAGAGGFAGAGGGTPATGGTPGGAGGAVSGDAGLVPLPIRRGARVAWAAESFVDSIGVNTHLGYTNGVYWDFESVREALVDSKIRFIRDGLPALDTWTTPTSTAGIVAERLRTLGAAGVRSTLLMGYPTVSADAAAYAGRVLALARALGPALAALEHTNEPDLFAARTDPEWIDHVGAFLEPLWAARSADPVLAGLPVLSTSVVEETELLALLAQFPAATTVVTHANTHPYPGGGIPEASPLRARNRQLGFYPGLPLIATETGYHTATNQTVRQPGVSELAQAVYLPRLFLESFAEGCLRSHIYELLDEWPDPERDEQEHNFGIVRHDGSRKPSFDAIRRLIAALEDPGAPFEPGAVDFRVDDRDVHHVLLEKRDGTFFIALWRPLSVYDKTAHADVPDAPGPVVVTFADSPSEVREHRPTASDAAPPLAVTNGAVTVSVGAPVVLLEVRGLPRLAAKPPLVDSFDGLDVASAHGAVAIERNAVRMYDYDPGLLVPVSDDGFVEYDVEGLVDFSVRAYRFCAGCVREPLDAVTAEASADGVAFSPIALRAVDRRPTMDAREIVSLVPAGPLPAGARHLRLRVRTSAPRIAEIRLWR